MIPSRGVDSFPSLPSTVIWVAAVFADQGRARRGEALLARLWAGGDLDVLDGVLVHRFAGDGAPAVRPVESLPRRAALPVAVWTDRLIGVSLRSPPTSVDRLPRLPTVAVGEAAALVFAATARLDQVTGILRTVDAVISVAPISAADFACLRGRPRPDSGHRSAQRPDGRST